MSKKAKKRYETVWILMLMQETGVVACKFIPRKTPQFFQVNQSKFADVLDTDSHMRSQNVHEGPSRVDDIEKYFSEFRHNLRRELSVST